jgi:uncharacterized membrane protein
MKKLISMLNTSFLLTRLKLLGFCVYRLPHQQHLLVLHEVIHEVSQKVFHNALYRAHSTPKTALLNTSSPPYPCTVPKRLSTPRFSALLQTPFRPFWQP